MKLEPKNRLGVCSWSLHAENPRDLATKVSACGLSRVQLALDPLRAHPEIWGDCVSIFAQQGITVISGMFGCVGEDYTTLESIRQTGGLAPDATWKQNLHHAEANAQLAAAMGLRLVTFHAGFLPHEESDPNYKKLLDRIAKVADIFGARQIQLGLETGQETANALAAALDRLNHPNVGVNLDPANILLYDKGDPVQAVDVLGKRIRQVHVKDAVRSKVAGQWGQEMRVGLGQVNWLEFFLALRDQGFEGNLVMEREAGHDRIGDIQTGLEFVRQHLPAGF